MDGRGGRDGGWDGASDPYDRFADLPPVDVEIPDDARELDEDLLRYQQEQRAERLRPPDRRVRFTRRWEAYGLSGPLVLAILLALALVGALVSLLVPRDPPPTTQVPLSTRATAPAGRPGGLLPVGRVRVAGAALDLRELRPAVLALVTPTCDCEEQLAELSTRATQYRLDLLLVHADPDAPAADETPRLRALAGRVRAQLAEDVDGVLRRTYQPGRLTVVLVRSDGVVNAVHRDLRDLQRLELDLARLPHPEAAS